MFARGKSTVFAAPFDVALQHKPHSSPQLPEPILLVATAVFQTLVL
jgi:hypothetical protein